jgi:ligand-binding sensor domain-containing protein
VLVLVSGCTGSDADTELPEGWHLIVPPDDVQTLFIEGEIVWAGGKDGVWEIDRETGTIRNKVSVTPSIQYARALIVDNNATLWIAHYECLTYVLRDGTSTTLTEADGLPDKRVNFVMNDTAGRIWIGTWSGAAVLENGLWRKVSQSDGLLDDMVNVILEDSRGCMWFGSAVAPAGGISICYPDNTWQYVTIDEGLLHNNINVLLKRHDSSIMSGGGLYKSGGGARFVWSDGRWVLNNTLSKEEDNLAGEKVRALFEDSNGNLWIGSEYDGLAVINQGRSVLLTKEDGLAHDEIRVFAEDREGNLWIGTRNGITMIEHEYLGTIVNEK